MTVPSTLVAIARWLLALAAPGLALAFTLLLRSRMDQVPSPPFFAAVMVTAWLGGLAPALLATAVSTASLYYFFLPSVGSLLGAGPLLWLLLFCTICVCTAAVVASRGRVQSRLAGSAQLVRLVADTAPQHVCYLDTDRRYRFANRPYAERYGLTPENIVGRHVSEVVPPEQYASIDRQLTDALAGRQRTFEVTSEVEGALRSLHVTYIPDADRAGGVRGVVAVVQDVTDRKRAEDERARLLALEQARRREAEAVAELGRLLTEGLHVDAVATRIAELARGLLRAVTTTVYRVDPVSRDFVCLAISGSMGGFQPGTVLPRGAGVVGRAVETGRPVTSPNVLEDAGIDGPPGTREWIEEAPYRAALAVPLRVKGRVIGAFAVGDRLGRVFTADEIRLAGALADHAAVALENARLYSEAEDRRREAELLAELARAVTASLDLDTVLGRVTSAARELCGADLARIALWDTARSGMAFRYTVGTRAGDHDHVLLLPGKGLAGHVLATGRPVRTENVLRDPRQHPDDEAMIRQEGSMAVLVAPIRMGQAIEGLIYVDNRTPRAFSDRHESILLRLADHAGIALRNARLFAGEQAARSEAEARAGRTRLLADVSRALSASLDYESSLATVGRLLVPGRADWCVVYLGRRDGSVRRAIVAHADPDQAELADQVRRTPPSLNWTRDTGAAVQALRAGRSLLLDQGALAQAEDLVDDPFERRLLQTLHPRAMLVVPLVARARTLGSLAWMRVASPEPYTAEDLDLAGDVAARAALAIDGARLYRQAERARIEAEGANQAKDEFLAVLSHELRTPLTSMLGWLRLLRAGQLSPERVAQALEVVERNTRTQAQLINDLLDVSRIITGKLQLDLYPLDLTPIMEEAVESARRDADARGVALALDLPDDMAAVLGDPLRLGQVVGNLLANAVKFTSTGGDVRASLTCREGEAVITIADTGVGIEPDVIAHVFDRFHQADSTITRRHGGLGLGLAIVRHLVELHGGSVTAASPGAGRGATFSVRLPLAPGGRRARPGETVATPAGAHGRAALTGVRVLVVEDHRDTAEMVRAVLDSHGAEVRVAESLARALALLRESDFDVLLSDVGMPDANGYELVQRLRERERTVGQDRLPAVAVTAFAGGEARERALAAGFSDYAAKPIEPAALVETVVRAAKGR
jgi:PAS domain S-box-containing protein